MIVNIWTHLMWYAIFGLSTSQKFKADLPMPIFESSRPIPKRSVSNRSVRCPIRVYTPLIALAPTVDRRFLKDILDCSFLKLISLWLEWEQSICMRCDWSPVYSQDFTFIATTHLEVRTLRFKHLHSSGVKLEYVKHIEWFLTRLSIKIVSYSFRSEAYWNLDLNQLKERNLEILHFFELLKFFVFVRN